MSGDWTSRGDLGRHIMSSSYMSFERSTRVIHHPAPEGLNQHGPIWEAVDEASAGLANSRHERRSNPG